jgi:hypothetical protein
MLYSAKQTFAPDPHLSQNAGMTARAKRGLLALFLAVAASFGVFWLPFLLPPAPLQAVSAANAAGFNNRVAVLAAGLLALLAVALSRSMRTPMHPPVPEDFGPMSRTFVFSWAILSGSLSAVLARMVYQAHIRYGYDYGYFISPATKLALDHLRLYTQVDFPYGPLLIYPVVWARGLFAWCDQPIAAAYSVLYVLEQVSGLLLVAYVLQAMPIRTSLRRFMFLAVWLCSLIPSLGMNGTFCRYAGPLALFIFAVRSRRPIVAAVLLAGGGMVCFGISPEMGFSFTCGSVAYALFRGLRESPAWFGVLFAQLGAAGLFLLVVGRGYRQMLELFSGGAYNLIVEPQPYVLFYLLALLWLAPVALAEAWQERQTDATMLSGLYAMGLGLLPVAFGRADYPHVFLNSLAILFLALVPVSRWTPKKRFLYVGAFLLVFNVNQITEHLANRYEMRQLPSMQSVRVIAAELKKFFQGAHSSHPGLPFVAKSDVDLTERDIDRLQSIIGGGRVCAPAGVSLRTEEKLRERKVFQPGAFFEMRDVLNRTVEQKQVDELNAEQWALLPRSGPIFMSESPESIQPTLELPFPYHSKRTPYVSGRLLEADLQKNWHVVDRVNGYLLYRRNW